MLWGPVVLGGLLNAVGAYTSSKALDSTMADVEGHLKPFKDSLDAHKILGEDYMDINSQINQDLLNTNIQTGMDFGSAQSRQLDRMISSGGVGGMSGIMAAQNRNIQNQAYSNANDAFYSQFLNNQKIGTGILGKYMEGMRGYSENLAQGEIAIDSSKAMNLSSLWGGMGKGMTDFGIAADEGEFEFV